MKINDTFPLKSTEAASDSLLIIKPGQQVRIGDGFIDAVVNQVSIEANNKIQYQVIWWEGNTRKIEWVSEFELNVSREIGITSVGFY